MARWALRLGVVVLGMVGVLAVVGVAYAHTEVTAEPAVAGATNAVLTFEAAAESPTAGISSVRIVLPEGIAPSDVTLKSGPSGWKLTATTDGYTVGGATLPQGRDAVHAVTVTRLPNATRLVFKALVNYSNGTVDRWIEEPTTANPNPDNPAPVLELEPAPTPPPTTAAPAPTSAPPTIAPGSSPAAAASSGESSGSPWLWWLLGAVAVALLVGGLALMRRRRAGQGPAA